LEQKEAIEEMQEHIDEQERLLDKKQNYRLMKRMVND